MYPKKLSLFAFLIATLLFNSFVPIVYAQPTVDIIYISGNSFKVGQEMIIRWDSTDQHHFSLELCKGTTAVGIIHYDGQQSSSEYFKWTIPAIVYNNDGYSHTVNGGSYTVKIVVWSDNYHDAPHDYDYSDYLEIRPEVIPEVKLTQPTGGNFEVGETMQIRWDSVNQHHYSIELFKGSAYAGEIYYDGVKTSKEDYSWTIPAKIYRLHRV